MKREAKANDRARPQLTFHVPIVASNVSSIIIWLRFRIPFTFHVCRFTFGW
ncbi:MAG: hypothetical protein NT167_14200 [Verrucomicrobia bacterium]|nr:hypothetical protein [Verrucomicrobiota bacterium]